MGKPPGQPELIIDHFSHPHPLQLTNYQSHINLIPVTCSCCKQNASGWIYTCSLCKYFLHVSCSQMPQRISHPFDQNHHVLSLLATPAYPEGSFNCDACGEKGSDGFSYHCGACNIDLHTYCASMPMTFTHQSHQHQLNLVFSPPYPCKSFKCDLCGSLGSKQWLYRCQPCEFDVHLHCAKMEQSQGASNPVRLSPHDYHHHRHQVQAPPMLQPVQAYQARPAPVVSVYQLAGNIPPAIRPTPAAVALPAMAAPVQVPSYAPNSYVIHTAAPTAFRPSANISGAGAGQQGNSLSSQILQSVIDSVGQTIGQDLMQSTQETFADGGGGDGDHHGGGESTDDFGEFEDLDGLFVDGTSTSGTEL